MTDRSAVNTIRGYYYQFDYSILRVLQLSELDQGIAIECIEDIDIHTATDVTAVQCKYYAGTEYNHSVIKPAIIHMLSHFKKFKDDSIPYIRYTLRGHYKSGHNKLKIPIDVMFLKQHFLSHKADNSQKCHHDELGLTDDDLAEFLNVLELDINAMSFEDQIDEIIRELMNKYNCTRFAAKYFYFNNAIATIRELAIEKQATKRFITKREFFEKIDTSSVLFNEWFVRRKGKKIHFAELRQEYFTKLNSSPFERFFLLEVEPNSYLRSNLKYILYQISEKWSKTSKRHGTSSFCPYVYLHGIDHVELINLKLELEAESFVFIDGYGFKDALFNVDSITVRAAYENRIKLKILNSIADLEATLSKVTKTREVYQFHLEQIYFETHIQAVKHVKIQLESLNDIMAII